MDLLADLFPPWNRWLAGGRLGSLAQVEVLALLVSCWGLRDHSYWDQDRASVGRDHLVASTPAAEDPNWVASSGVDILRESSLVALAVPDAGAFQDAARAATVEAVPNADPSADGVDLEDVVAYVVVEVPEGLLDHPGLAYDVEVEDPGAPRDLAVEAHSYAGGRAAEVGVREHSGSAVHAVVGDLAFAYVQPDHLVVGLVDRADEADLVLDPYAEDLGEVPVVVDKGYAVRGTVRGSAKVAPLDLALEAEAWDCSLARDSPSCAF